MRRTLLLSLALVASVALTATPAAAAASFPETGYSITSDKIQDYFEHRGGVRVFGYPISREFDFMGTRVQFFQRAVLQLQSGGGVGLINLLSDDLLPYTRINGSTFPAADPSLLGAAPSPADPDFATKAMDFARLHAPDSWEGMKTNFYSTMVNTVSYQEAFPNGGVDPGLMPLINLEIWGLPTSRPTYDPNNSNFVYLRFQRGIMHFDKSSGLTQGILLGDYLKSVLSGQNLPGDLAQAAQGSKLYRQYDNGVMNGVARSWDLSASNLFAAFEKEGVVVPTPPPATPTPQPTPTPVAPTATPVSQAPANIEVVGEGKFLNQVNYALEALSRKTPYNYSLVKQFVYRIEFVDSSSSSTDYATRTLKINEATAFPGEWSSYEDNQREWLAGLIVHNAVHISQHAGGAATTGSDAEREALLRQQDALAAVETTSPGGQFWKYVQNALDNNSGWFGDYQLPRGPETE
ncbi:MAG: hypothetical protein ACYC5J_17030 [Chloroflexota bacterium]